MTMLNVAIAEDNPKTMEVLNEMLEKESGVQIVGRAQTGEDALEMIKTTKPDGAGEKHRGPGEKAVVYRSFSCRK